MRSSPSWGVCVVEGGVVGGGRGSDDPAPEVAPCLPGYTPLPSPPLLPGSYVNEYPTGRLLRDAKLYEIGAGTSEIRRLVIGRALFREGQ